MMLLLMLTAAAADGEKQTEGRRRLQAAPPWWQLHHHFHFVRLSSSDWSSKSRIGFYFEPACLYISSQPACSSSELRRLRASLAARAATFEEQRPSSKSSDLRRLRASLPARAATFETNYWATASQPQHQHGSPVSAWKRHLLLCCFAWPRLCILNHRNKQLHRSWDMEGLMLMCHFPSPKVIWSTVFSSFQAHGALFARLLLTHVWKLYGIWQW